MPKKKEKKIVDTGFVPGIYNYCDRWCERCPLQLRCMSYMMGKKLKERTKVNLGEEMPDDDESALARLKNIFDSTFDVLRELAEERGMGIPRRRWIGDSGGRITRIWKMRMKRRSGR